MKRKEKKVTPSSRSRTSDLWISAAFSTYSPPLCQLSYRRLTVEGLIAFKHKYWGSPKEGCILKCSISGLPFRGQELGFEPNKKQGITAIEATSIRYKSERLE
ncbi:hypothetical protein AVEN_238497-1 [Araneus ventricosus]|uniref:Uncharacterized protein n=1 Tax=Araneus ventricosus TaxID=182803 RepID=A0A4Y2T340_ARAVE|nr:hypothetical protein AVEN_74854-1 [Araneus ventricosus]GBN94435.1 hypothetical protein AVEN_238497-1 [Araneus ventricosus]